MTKLQFLLALIASMLLFNLYGCESPTGTVDDDDDIIDDDDDATGDDDDDTGTIVLSVHEDLPTVQVVVSRIDSEERTMTECHTVCELREIPAGHYSGEAMLEDGLFAPIEFDVVADQTFAHTFAGGFTHDGSYGRFMDSDGTQQIGDTTFEISTYTESGVVKTEIQGAGIFDVEGDTIVHTPNPDVYGITLVPNETIEFHAVDGGVFYYIQTPTT